MSPSRGWTPIHNLIAEFDGNGALQRRYVHGPGDDEPLVQYNADGSKYFLHANEQGSIILITNSSGGQIATNAYDEYGLPRAGNTGRFQYTGQVYLPEIGMHYYKARIYHPVLGRFMQTDPIGYGDGMNWYAYVQGDPVNMSDPSGLQSAGTLSLPGGCSIGYTLVPGPNGGIGADGTVTVSAEKQWGSMSCSPGGMPSNFGQPAFDPRLFHGEGGGGQSPAAEDPKSEHCAAPSSGKSDIPMGAGEKSFSEAASIARRIALEELARTKRITDNYRLGGHNDIYDAERHARWVYRMSVAVGSGWAGLFATGHEGEGMLDGQPSIEMKMDLSNNSLGMNAAVNGTGIPTRKTPGLKYIRNGQLVRKGC